MAMAATPTVPFGRHFRHDYFLFQPGYVPLNQGSYGAYPRHVQAALRAVQDEVQQDPDGFVRYIYPVRLNAVRKLVAGFLHADLDDIVLVPNATTGLNAVLRNMAFHEGDKIAHIQGIYGAIEKTIDYLVETTAVESVCVPFDPAIDNDDVLVQTFRSVLKENHGRIKVAVFDTVMSMPGLLMPFERLSMLCREFGVLSVIDGAHGIGLVELDLKALDADFLITNCHKWLFVPHTCSVLYVASRNQHLMRSSLPTSHGFQPAPDILQGKEYMSSYEPAAAVNPFVFQFEYCGTIDNAPPLCIPAALDFRQRICGGEAMIRDYCRRLAKEGEIRVASILESSALTIPESKRIAFANVRLPIRFHSGDDSACRVFDSIPMSDLQNVLRFILQTLKTDYNTFVNVAFFSGYLWARFSAQIYLDVEDFDHGAWALKDICRRVVQREYIYSIVMKKTAKPL